MGRLIGMWVVRVHDEITRILSLDDRQEIHERYALARQDGPNLGLDRRGVIVFALGLNEREQCDAQSNIVLRAKLNDLIEQMPLLCPDFRIFVSVGQPIPVRTDGRRVLSKDSMEQVVQ